MSGHMSEEASTLNNLIGILSAAKGMVPGVGGVAAGLVGMLSGGMATADSTGTDRGLAAAGTVATGFGTAGSIAGLLGVGTGFQLGALSTTAGIAGNAAATSAGGLALGGAAAVGNVVSAGLAGMAAGTMAAHVIDGHKGGIFGQNQWGQDRSAFDWASDQGHGVSDALGGGTLGDVGGAATAGLLSIPAAGVGGLKTVADWLFD